jgi:hypothetical protein
VTWTVAQVAVETGIAPSELLADRHLLRAIVAVLVDREREARKAQKRKG